MWLNRRKTSAQAIKAYQAELSNSRPHHWVIDDLFEASMMDQVVDILQRSDDWRCQKHSYDALYVDDEQWGKTPKAQRFVQRDVWKRQEGISNAASRFLEFLREDEFMGFLSNVFSVRLTDLNVESKEINSNYFRLGCEDFVEQHADDSPGREVCMLLYLNKDWKGDMGGELTFLGAGGKPIRIAPTYNRCIFFDPSSTGSEHWVSALNHKYADMKRYNVTSWYWSE